MKKLNLLIGILIGFTILSCSSDDNSCLQSKTLDIAFGEELGLNNSKVIYSDSNYKIWISSYTSPNGDGINDEFMLLIRNLENGEEFDSTINNNAIEFISEGELIISNECEEIFSTNNINDLTWYPGYEPPQPEGIYNVNLNLTLANNTNLDLEDTFEVILTSNLP
jgi:hypothetical protein